MKYGCLLAMPEKIEERSKRQQKPRYFKHHGNLDPEMERKWFFQMRTRHMMMMRSCKVNQVMGNTSMFVLYINRAVEVNVNVVLKNRSKENESKSSSSTFCFAFIYTYDKLCTQTEQAQISISRDFRFRWFISMLIWMTEFVTLNILMMWFDMPSSSSSSSSKLPSGYMLYVCSLAHLFIFGFPESVHFHSFSWVWNTEEKSIKIFSTLTFHHFHLNWQEETQ